MHRKQIQSQVRDRLSQIKNVSVSFTKDAITLSVPLSQPEKAKQAKEALNKIGCVLKKTSGHINVYAYPSAA